MKFKFAAAISAFFISTSVQAAEIAISELPTLMQNCFSGNGCSPWFGSSASLESSYDSPTMSAFKYLDISTGGLEEKWLIRYNVTSPSNQNGTALTGNVWLSANQTYDLSNSTHNFTIYTEKVAPTLWNGGVMGDLTHQLSLTTSSLFAGGGTMSAGLDASNNSYHTGTLTVSNGFVPCAAETCSIDAIFNLINLSYLNTGSLASLTFNSTDKRGLLFQQTSSYPGDYSFNYQQQLYVQPVPLPAGFWLLFSGLAGLGCLARKR